MTRQISGLLLFAVTVWLFLSQLVYAQSNYDPTDVCAGQVLRRYHVNWSDIETWLDRQLNNGAVLVGWRIAGRTGYCEISRWGDVRRFVVEREADNEFYGKPDPARACAYEAARQRRVDANQIRTKTRHTDASGRVVVEWYSPAETGYCEVSRRGRVEYFKVTQAKRNSFANAEQICRDAVINRRNVNRRQIVLSKDGQHGNHLRINWRTKRESGYCEIDRRSRLVEFRVDKRRGSSYRSQEGLCQRFIARKLKIRRNQIQVLRSYSKDNERVRVDWRVGSKEGYCSVQYDRVIDTSLR